MNEKRTCGICGLMHEPHHDIVRTICVDTALAELASLRAAVSDRDAAIARMTEAHDALCAALDNLHFSGSVDGLGAVADARAMWPDGDGNAAIARAVEAEREACAKISETCNRSDWSSNPDTDWRDIIAAAIRARNETKEE